MTPPITTYHQLVLAERAAALARVDKQRIGREYADAARTGPMPNPARAGVDSFRARFGGLLIHVGSIIAGGHRAENRRGGTRIVSAHR